MLRNDPVKAWLRIPKETRVTGVRRGYPDQRTTYEDERVDSMADLDTFCLLVSRIEPAPEEDKTPPAASAAFSQSRFDTRDADRSFNLDEDDIERGGQGREERPAGYNPFTNEAGRQGKKKKSHRKEGYGQRRRKPKPKDTRRRW